MASLLHGWVALGKVIILAREEVVAALLGLMVELQGLPPKLLGSAEDVEDVILREKPRAVVIDCDHPDCRDDVLETIKKAGALPVLFSPFRMQPEVKSAAERHWDKVFYPAYGCRDLRGSAPGLS